MAWIAAYLPEGLSAGPALFLIAASFFTSATTAALGMGGGVMMLALMGLFIPVAALIPVQGIVQLGSNTGRTWVLRAHVQTGLMKPFIAGSLVGAVIGGLTVVQLPDAFMKIALGAFILFITWGRIPGLAKLSGVMLAVVSGVVAMLSMFLGATGPLMVSVFAALIPHDRKKLVATCAVALTVHHGLKVLVFGMIGFSFREWLLLIPAMIATGYLGTLSGSALLSRIPEATFRLAFKIAITLLALDMLRHGLGY